ncbi:MAG: Fur family transcriptional regulator, partial [Dehalococcoidia bacterium]
MPRIEELLAERLEGRGYRITPPRRVVLKAIEGRKGHFTADEICHQAGGVGRATVFRTMKLLVDLGLVCRVLLESGNLH